MSSLCFSARTYSLLLFKIYLVLILKSFVSVIVHLQNMFPETRNVDRLHHMGYCTRIITSRYTMH